MCLGESFARHLERGADQPEVHAEEGHLNDRGEPEPGVKGPPDLTEALVGTGDGDLGGCHRHQHADPHGQGHGQQCASGRDNPI